jgi:hypothetical protein
MRAKLQHKGSEEARSQLPALLSDAERGQCDLGVARVVDEERRTGQALGLGNGSHVQSPHLHACPGNPFLIGIHEQ